MSELIIKIGDEYLDLSGGETIAITKQAAKVGDFSKVLADGTNEVRVPATAHNIATLENAQLMQSESDKPYRRNNATLIQEGYETLQDGFAIVKSFSKDFSLQLVGGNASFFNLIKDLNLRDLDLSEFDHFWTNQNVFDNRNNSSGFVYALFEQSEDAAGTLQTTGVNTYVAQTDLLLPCFFIHTLVSKIFQEQGYVFVHDITASDIYTWAAVFKGSDWNRGTDSSYLNLTVTSQNDVTLIYNAIINASVGSPMLEDGAITNQEVAYWDQSSLNNLLLTGRSSMTGDLFEIDGSVLLLPDATRVQVTFSLLINNPGASGGMQLTAGVVHSTESGDIAVQHTYLPPSGVSTWNFSFDINVTQTPVTTDYFNAGETGCFFSIFFQRLSGSSEPVIQQGSTATYSFEFISAYQVTQYLPYNYLRGFTPLPDQLQGDFLKELAKMFQWVFDTNEATHTVTARRFDEIKEKEFEAIDFSDKLHNDKQDITFGIDGYAQINLLKWKPDDITKFTAQGQINVDDQTLDAEKTLVEMAQFAATSTVSRFDTVGAPYVPLFTGPIPSNGMTDRMMLIRPTTFPYFIEFKRDGSDPVVNASILTFAYFMEAGNPDSLDFPNLINRFYQAVISMNFRAKSLTGYFNLKIKDVVNYDPFIPVYIQKYNQYFYWEKLENYVKNKLTKCKLIKL